MNLNGHTEPLAAGESKTNPNLHPAYKSHKTVRAVKIQTIAPGSAPGRAIIRPEDPGCVEFEVGEAYMEKHKPAVGGYFVTYADGYQSYSPAKAFEEGNTLIADLPASISAPWMESKVKEVFYTLMPDGRTTVCMLVMKNGFTMLGSSVCQPATDFNEETGKQWAYEDALGKAWPLEVYLLAEQKLQAGS